MAPFPKEQFVLFYVRSRVLNAPLPSPKGFIRLAVGFNPASSFTGIGGWGWGPFLACDYFPQEGKLAGLGAVFCVLLDCPLSLVLQLQAAGSDLVTSCHNRFGLSGISSISMPVSASASSSACAKSGPTGIAPASPTPLTPIGLSGEGVSS